MEEEDIRHIITHDGSSTLYSARYDQHYHSIHGAIQESMHVFIEAGLRALPEHLTEVAILEMGFGTGLNALLTLVHNAGKQLHYTGLETIPLNWEQAYNLNYIQELKLPEAGEWFQAIHHAAWNETVAIKPDFSLEKLQCQLQDFAPERGYDLLYFDAFAPTSQPELWEPGIMQQLYDWLNPGGIFVTYSAKSSVRKGLIAAGFDVSKLPGPPGKREMLRGIKN